MLRLEEADASEEPHRERLPDLEHANAHLSNERAFLAWVWTGMALMGFGVGIAKMRVETYDLSQVIGAGSQSTGAPEIGPITMGVLFLFLGLLTIVASACRYFTVHSHLCKRKYQTSHTLVYILFTGIIALGAMLIVYVIRLR